MKMYTTEIMDEPPIYHADLGSVNRYVRGTIATWRDEITVAQIEVPTDKASILQLLNQQHGEYPRVREWRGKVRGGIEPI